MEMPIDTSEDLTEMAAACYPLARVAITAIKNDVLELIADEHRESAQALLMNLEQGDTFKTANLDLLPALIKALDAQIAKGTRYETFYDNSAENVSHNNSWSQTRLTLNAQRLHSAKLHLRDLCASVYEVYDLLRAQTMIEAYRSAAPAEMRA
ncbi:hypothetical protein [Pararhodobacter oceanensis]|uniref:Uncharacterized protein n=1 Tax=Pararhodobacter oceanensis TaxID=2172121 RepID=A0A2T8HP62_9RHOB|nr:hypothetical protein [Pararhodobacter oceanensis]PVH27226.1 hypothetical protein DDE20_18725 [Pararhodobacter oceanensis]